MQLPKKHSLCLQLQCLTYLPSRLSLLSISVHFLLICCVIFCNWTKKRSSDETQHISALEAMECHGKHRPRPVAVPPIVCVAPPRLLGSPTPLHPSCRSCPGMGEAFLGCPGPRVNFHGAPLHGGTAPWRNRALLLNPFDGRKPFGTKNWQDPCKIHEFI